MFAIKSEKEFTKPATKSLTAYACICCIALFSASAKGQPISPASEISSINERIAVMSARLAELEMQARINTKINEVQRLEAASGAGALSSASVSLPTILEIGGIDGRLWVRVQMRGGTSQVLRAGDRTGGWTVQAITVDSVTVRRGRDTQRLSFGEFADPPAANQQLLPVPAMLAPMPGMALSSSPIQASHPGQGAGR